MTTLDHTTNTAGAGALVITPTYNELESLPGLLEEIRRHLPAAEVLVVDDSSPDGTATLVAEMQKERPWLHLIVRPGKGGIGTAYIAGFRFALQRDYNYIVQMDADLSHPPDRLPALISALRSADLALGTRHMPEGSVENWELGRRILSRLGNLYARLCLALPYRDLTSGYKAFARSALEKAPLNEVGSEGYAFQVELTYRLHKKGIRIVEIPIRFAGRARGESKMSWAIFIEAVYRTPLLRFIA